MTQAIAAMCMRSPAPTEPALGTIGCTPALSIATSSCTASSVSPRAAARGAADAGEHRGAHVLGVERRADAARMRLDHLALVALQDVERHAVVAHVAEPGVEPVDQPLAGDGAVDDRAAREDRRLHLGRELDPRELARDAHDVRRRDAAGADDDAVGHEAPAWATSSMPSSRSGSR